MLPALQPLLDGSLQVTALVATTFSGAVLASEILSARGRRIPEDISIVALADPRPSALHTPPMTVVRFSAVSLTETAVDLLIGMLAGRPPRRLEHLVPVELAASGSTGPPAVTLRTGTSIGRQRSLPRPRQQDGAGSAQARP
jgi:DNA-binding LacI/PurR family transcriptional regulator